MNFAFKWRHRDGSIVEFSSRGWSSNDPQKASWLAKMNELCSSPAAISPGIRRWLQEHCELIAFSGPNV
jgi:hypothetical protein